MILVTLGTQDKSFDRLLASLDQAIEDKKITDEVIVQAGYTYNTYHSKNMRMFDYVDVHSMQELVKQADVVISHAGAGSILTALENNKKIIVVPRLSKYGEHNNDHQVEIAEEFSKDGYVIYLSDLNDLVKTLNNIDKFKPKKLGHNEEVLTEIENFIDNINPFLRIKKIIFLAFILMWMIAIFFLSSMDGDYSNFWSKKAVNKVITTTEVVKEKVKNKAEVVSELNKPARKFAHATVYFVLAILIMVFLHQFKINNFYKVIITLIICLIYAMSDEYHQLYVMGRTGEVIDVLIDTLGAFISSFICLIIILVREPKKRVRKKVLFVSSVGGHLTQLLKLEKLFNNYDYKLVTEKLDVTLSLKNKYKVIYYIYCNKKNFIKYFFINVINAFHAIYTFISENPDCIVTTGANTSVPLCYLCFIFRRKVIFIESYAKRSGKTLAGSLVYPIATTFIVQWEEMKKYYPKAKYYGGIY